MSNHRVRPPKDQNKLKLDPSRKTLSKNYRLQKHHNTLNDGYNMLEIVIAVGLILILSAGGILVFSGITADAKLSKVTSAAKSVYTAAMTSQLDNDPETSPTDTATRYNDSNEAITIKIRETGLPPADWETAPDFVPQSGDDFCITAIWNDQPTIKGSTGFCSVDNGGGIIPPDGGGGGYIWDTRTTMTTTWNTSLGANCETINLPVKGVKPGTTVDWGDGAGAVAFSTTSPNYGNSGVKTIIIDGQFTTWSGVDEAFTSLAGILWGDANCLTQVTQWGDTGTTNLVGAFVTANNLTKVEAIPQTTKLFAMAFYGITGEPDISGIRTPNVTNMSGTFAETSKFNPSLVNLDTSKVIDMEFMFQGAQKFNQPLNFDTSNVIKMKAMFNRTDEFNQPLNFNTSKVEEMDLMFDTAAKFNQNLSGWNVSKVVERSQFDRNTPNWVLPKPNFN